MNVLQLISSSGFFGADNVLIELSKELQHTDFSPIIGVFENAQNPHLEVAEEAKREGFPVTIFPCNGRLDFRTILLIRRFLEQQQINIIHTHGYKSNLYALAASLSKKASLVTTCHNWLGDDPKMRFYARLDKFFLSRFDRIIAVSDSVKQDILNHNISPKKVLAIHNGIEIDRFDNKENENGLRRGLGIDENCKVIGTVGRLSEEKGHIHLLKASEKVLKEYPKVVFLIVGDGPLRRHLEAKSCELATELISSGTGCSKTPLIFTGVRSDMPAIYSLMDVFVLPSLTEGLPMVLLEAMASMLPVVATRVGDVPAVVKDNETGLLIEPGDEKGIKESLVYLLKNPEIARDMGEMGCKKVKEHYSSKKMAREYIDIYNEALESKNYQQRHTERAET